MNRTGIKLFCTLTIISNTSKQVRVRTGVAQLVKLRSGHIWFGLVSLASFGQAWFVLGELISVLFERVSFNLFTLDFHKQTNTHKKRKRSEIKSCCATKILKI